MILMDWIRRIRKGNVVDIKLYSYATGFCFEQKDPEKILTKDLYVEAVIKDD